MGLEEGKGPCVGICAPELLTEIVSAGHFQRRISRLVALWRSAYGRGRRLVMFVCGIASRITGVRTDLEKNCA